MNKKIGFTCAYTPVPLIEAAGFSPFRIFPESKAPDQAGHLLHDNLCPHVKKVLDRALADDLPDLEGMVFINSCDSMRRLADAWNEARPDDRIILMDLPSGINNLSLDFLSKEYERLAKTLFKWNNETFSPEIMPEIILGKIKDKIDNWNLLASSVKKIEKKISREYFPGIASQLQQIINTAATDSTDKALAMTQKEIGPEEPAKAGRSPVFVFGNLLFDPKVFDLFEEWNMHVTASDFCTTSRFITPVDTRTDNNIFRSLADSYLNQTPCARTMDTTRPGSIAQRIVERAKESNAKGVIGVTLKFCDPHLARIPMIRQALQKESIPYSMDTSERIRHMQDIAGAYGIDGAINPCHWGCRQGTGTRGLISKGLKDINVPVLNLEIDCVDSRNLAKGQIETRVEAFIEMLS